MARKLSKGKELNHILEEMKMVAEGVNTCKAVYEIAKEIDIEMPITYAVYQILFQSVKPINAVPQLMERQLKSESHGDLLDKSGKTAKIMKKFKSD